MNWKSFRTPPKPGTRIIGINADTQEWVAFTVFQHDQKDDNGKVIRTREEFLKRFINEYGLSYWMVPVCGDYK